MYGRQPENIEVINQVFHNLLGKYPSGSVLKAFEIWMIRNQEFPTPADIVGLIKRKGKAPLSKEVYIAASKKDPEHRSSSDWAYLREYEAEMQESEWGVEEGFDEPQKTYAYIAENRALRTQITEMQKDYDLLAEVLHKERRARDTDQDGCNSRVYAQNRMF